MTLQYDTQKIKAQFVTACIPVPTFFQSGDSHGWLTQARLCLPFAFIGVVHLHRGQRGLLLIHTPKHHQLPPQHHSWGTCPCSRQWWNLGPSLTLHIQDLNTVQRHTGLTAAPQNINEAFVVDRSTVHTALRHGWELLPVQWLHWTHSHFQYRHVSGIKTKCHTQHCCEGARRANVTGTKKYRKPAEAQAFFCQENYLNKRGKYVWGWVKERRKNLNNNV